MFPFYCPIHFLNILLIRVEIHLLTSGNYKLTIFMSILAHKVILFQKNSMLNKYVTQISFCFSFILLKIFDWKFKSNRFCQTVNCMFFKCTGKFNLLLIIIFFFEIRNYLLLYIYFRNDKTQMTLKNIKKLLIIKYCNVVL